MLLASLAFWFFFTGVFYALMSHKEKLSVLDHLKVFIASFTCWPLLGVLVVMDIITDHKLKRRK